MAAPRTVAEPEKELRFTREAQAQGFFIGAAVAFGGCLVFLFVLHHPSIQWWLAAAAAVLGGLLVKTAFRCTRHAYLILTPLGIEVFPWRQPEKNLEERYWAEIDSAEFSEDGGRLTLHFNAEKTAGMVISLAPVAEKRLPLLRRAVEGRLKGGFACQSGLEEEGSDP